MKGDQMSSMTDTHAPAEADSPVTTRQQQARADYIAGLRALADLLDQNDDVPLPWTGKANGSTALTFYSLGQGDVSRDEAAAFARAFPGKLAKVYERDVFTLRGLLGGLHVEFTTYRSDVCERVVTGTREVTIEVPDPTVTVPTVTETRVVEDFEWVCAPVLGGAA